MMTPTGTELVIGLVPASTPPAVRVVAKIRKIRFSAAFLTCCGSAT